MLASTLFTFLAAATSVLASIDAKQCTTTIVTPNQGCCVGPAVETTTSIDCHGCAIQTNPGPRCDIICQSTKTIPTSTRTHTVCKASATPKGPVKIITTMATHVKARAEATCTTAFHDTNTGCCGPRPVRTVTETVNCHGCKGVNVAVPHCQIFCSETVTNPLFVSTKTVCAAATSHA